jgi:hypothetical protein
MVIELSAVTQAGSLAGLLVDPAMQGALGGIVLGNKIRVSPKNENVKQKILGKY